MKTMVKRLIISNWTSDDLPCGAALTFDPEHVRMVGHVL